VPAKRALLVPANGSNLPVMVGATGRYTKEQLLKKLSTTRTTTAALAAALST
jgi:hypothetical protein